MIRRGDVLLEEGLVLAVEPGGAKGCRLTIETDEQVKTRTSGWAEGYEQINKAPRYVIRTFYVAPEVWADLVDLHHGADLVLGKRVCLADLGPRVFSGASEAK